MKNIRKFQERGKEIEARLEPFKVISMLKPGIALSASISRQIILRRKLCILKGLIRKAIFRPFTFFLMSATGFTHPSSPPATAPELFNLDFKAACKAHPGELVSAGPICW